MKYESWQIFRKGPHWNVWYHQADGKIKPVGYYGDTPGYPVHMPFPPAILSDEMVDNLAEFIRWIDEQFDIHKPRILVMNKSANLTKMPERLKTPDKSTLKAEDIDGDPREDDGAAKASVCDSHN